MKERNVKKKQINMKDRRKEKTNNYLKKSWKE